MPLSGNLCNTDIQQLQVSLSFYSSTRQKSIYQITVYISDLKPALRTVEYNRYPKARDAENAAFWQKIPKTKVQQDNRYFKPKHLFFSMQRTGKGTSLTLFYTGFFSKTFPFSSATYTEFNSCFTFKKRFNIESLGHQNLQISHTCSVPQLAHIFIKVQKEHRCANQYVQRNANQAEESRLSII